MERDSGWVGGKPDRRVGRGREKVERGGECLGEENVERMDNNGEGDSGNGEGRESGRGGKAIWEREGRERIKAHAQF